MLRLYYAPRTVSAAAAITLNEAGLPYETACIDFKSLAQNKTDYHRINPKGRVPALQTNDGVLTETSAILDYVGALAPKANLVPGNPFQAARMRSIMTFLASTWHVNHAMGGRGARWARKQSSFDDMKSKVAENIGENCRYFEEEAFSGPFAIGTQFTLADPYLYTVTTWLPFDGVDIAVYPRLFDFQQRMHERKSVQRAHADGFF